MRPLSTFAIAATLAVGLAGCGINQRQAQQAQVAERNAKVATCMQQFGEGHRADRWRCISSVHEAYMHTFTYPDLVRLLDAQKQAIAAKEDAGKITLDEAKLQAARAGAEITSMEEQRNAIWAGANAARVQAATGLLSVQQQNYQQQQLQQQQMPWMRPTINCSSNRSGTFVSTTCN